MPHTLKDVIAMAEELKEKADALYFSSMQGIKAEDGILVPDKKILTILAQTFEKPLIGADTTNGALCAVVTTGQEQGSTAAKMLLRALEGTPVSEIPITRNYQGKRVINVSLLKAFGIKPRPDILRGAELVITEE
jgi:ABC-type uncharacterized transport system substrate-binding protein